MEVAAAIANFSYRTTIITPVGRIYASFIVDTDGSLKDIVFLTILS